MESNIFQQLQAIEQQLLAKKGVQVHIHVSFSPGSAGLSESDVQQLMSDVDSMCEKEAATKPSPNRGRIEVVNDSIRITLFSATGETNASLKGVTAENMAEAARILSAWLDAPPQKRVWREWSKPNRPGLWAFTYPAANGTVFYQEVSEEGAKIPTRWGEGHWCWIGPAPKIEYRQKQEEPETIPTEHCQTKKPKCGFVVLKFRYDRPNKVGIWAYKTSTEFSDGRLAYTVVDDVGKCNVVPSPGRWAYVGDHR